MANCGHERAFVHSMEFPDPERRDAKASVIQSKTERGDADKPHIMAQFRSCDRFLGASTTRRRYCLPHIRWTRLWKGFGMPISKALLILAASVATVTLAPSSADAKCTRLAFSVNDYGKEGPIRDAKAQLDKYIASWTAERGIKSFSTGKKDVTCELFLDFGVFDEHTCKAAATVCWPDGQKATRASTAGDGSSAKPPAKKTSSEATSPTTTGSVNAPRPAAKSN